MDLLSLAFVVANGALMCLLIPVGIAIVVAIGIAAYKAEQKRKAEFLAVASENGLRYDPESHGDWDDRWPRFECFHRGHSRCAFNLLTGRLGGDGPECALGEYRFKETHGSGKNRRTVTYTFGFAILDVGLRGVPDVLIRKEHLFDKVAGFFGFDDIDFESVEFSRSFMVKSSDKRFAYDLIDAQMMEFLLGQGTPNIDIGSASAGGAVCLWFGQSSRLGPRELISLAQWGRSFIGRWPRVVRAVPGEQI
ncbi:MAG: hypothetical protein JNL80_08865 [Phycisphaerae bacterium]|jgi:hypothetical protein|nr:hypothetical protein [Phycisphaerae bacterium]